MDATDATIPSPWLTAHQARAYLQMRDTQLTQLLNAGTIPSYRRGRTRYVHVSDLDAYMRSLPSGACQASRVLQSS